MVTLFCFAGFAVGILCQGHLAAGSSFSGNRAVLALALQFSNARGGIPFGAFRRVFQPSMMLALWPLGFERDDIWLQLDLFAALMAGLRITPFSSWCPKSFLTFGRFRAAGTIAFPVGESEDSSLKGPFQRLPPQKESC